jgi:hypothetical protein
MLMKGGEKGEGGRERDREIGRERKMYGPITCSCLMVAPGLTCTGGMKNLSHLPVD